MAPTYPQGKGLCQESRRKGGTGSDTPGVQRLARKGEPILNKPGLPISPVSGVAS